VFIFVDFLLSVEELAYGSFPEREGVQSSGVVGVIIVLYLFIALVGGVERGCW